MVRIIFQDDGNGPYLRSDVTAVELAAWEAANEMKWENGILIPTPLTLDELKTAKELEIRAKGSVLMLQIVTPYTAEERDTWPSQVSEAKAYTENPAAATPMLSALVAQRGNTVANQAARILGNEAAFKTAVGVILGIQQAKIDLIAVATLETIGTITWES